MSESQAELGGEERAGARGLWKGRVAVAVACAVVMGVYGYTAHSGYLVSTSLQAGESYYNLLVDGFRSGQLSVKKEVPVGLTKLADPYEPGAHFPYRVLDLSYYKGKLYLYFGVTPVLVLFWPYVVLTGQYLVQKDAAVIFCSVGFLVSVGLLWAMWRRYFAKVSVWAVVAGTLGLGLTNCAPLLLARCDVHEVSIACGYGLTMLALGGVWKALQARERQAWWLAGASVAYGLAVGSRPSLLLGSVVLLVPVWQAWREREKVWSVLLAALGPIALIGLGLMWYNWQRFDNPLEFGWRYQLAGDRQDTGQRFSVRYLWFNFRVYFLGVARWSREFPFVHDIRVPMLPVGHGRVEHPYGVLTNIPVVWLALAVPMAWRGRARLGWFVGAVAALFGISALTLGLFFAACGRYEVEFVAPLVWLAAVGYLGLEQACALRRPWVWTMRWSAAVLLGLSVVFNLLACVERCAEAQYDFGNALAGSGRESEAIAHYEHALYLKPDFAEAHNNLAGLLWRAGRTQEAMEHYQQALQVNPDFAQVHYCLGVALEAAGRVREAMEHYERAVRIKPDLTEAQNNLGNALLAEGRAAEAIGHFEQALRVRPDSAESHINLANALAEAGRGPEAIRHYELALRLKPDFVEAHYGLGLSLSESGRTKEAMGHYEAALRINPNFAEAHYELGVAFAEAGNLSEAIKHWEQALQINPDYAEAHYNLGLAMEQTGRIPEAKQHYEQALRARPGFIEAQVRLTRLRGGSVEP